MISLTALGEAAPDFATLSLLALIQGATEFLPISSSGHLVLVQSAVGIGETALSLDVALHLGTLLAVVVVYREDLRDMIAGIFRGELREPGLIALGSVPATVLGLLFKEDFEAAFHQPRIAAAGLLVTAVLLFVGEWWRRRCGPRAETGKRLGWGGALLIGTAQALAICPGISRSGATIVTGVLCGLAPARAARFSFLLSIPVILGASALSLPDLSGEAALPLAPLLWAALFAGFVGWGAMRALLRFLGRGAFAWFAAYCVGLGTGALLFA